MDKQKVGRDTLFKIIFKIKKALDWEISIKRSALLFVGGQKLVMLMLCG